MSLAIKVTLSLELAAENRSRGIWRAGRLWPNTETWVSVANEDLTEVELFTLVDDELRSNLIAMEWSGQYTLTSAHGDASALGKIVLDRFTVIPTQGVPESMHDRVVIGQLAYAELKADSRFIVEEHPA